jgi:hypothetical protein
LPNRCSLIGIGVILHPEILPERVMAEITIKLLVVEVHPHMQAL